MTSDDELYQHWLEQQRGQRPGPELTDRIMAVATQADIIQPTTWLVLVLMWIERSRLRRFAACAGALLAGSTPFVYLAYISRAFVF